MKTLEKRIRLKSPPKKRTKEQAEQQCIRYILRRVKTGDIDMDKLSHRIGISIVLKKDLVFIDEDGDFKIKEE